MKVSNSNAKEFSAVNNSGFKMTFSNGWTVSVMWGVGNYASNKEKGEYFLPREFMEFNSGTAEIAAWHTELELHWDFANERATSATNLGRLYEGWLSPSMVLAFMNKISQWEAANEI